MGFMVVAVLWVYQRQLFAGSDMLPKPHVEAEPGPRRADRQHTEYPRLFQHARSLRKPALLRCISPSWAASGLYLVLPILVENFADDGMAKFW